VSSISRRAWVRLAFAFVGLLGATFAISGVVVALPPPAARGTCGPGLYSEAPIVALFNPGSIGAGPEPPATNAEARDQWSAFVSECQASADGRVLAGVVILVASVAIGVFGPMVVLRRKPEPGPGYPPSPAVGGPPGDAQLAPPPPYPSLAGPSAVTWP
jgi:hypothetical protein